MEGVDEGVEVSMSKSFFIVKKSKNEIVKVHLKLIRHISGILGWTLTTASYTYL